MNFKLSSVQGSCIMDYDRAFEIIWIDLQTPCMYNCFHSKLLSRARYVLFYHELVFTLELIKTVCFVDLPQERILTTLEVITSAVYRFMWNYSCR